MPQDLLDKIVNAGLDRRNFVKRVGVTGLGVAATAMLGSKLMNAQETADALTTSFTDVDILNFALNLEFLEAEFYLMATYGTTLQKFGILNANQVSGPTTGGKMVDFSKSAFAFVASGLRTDEVAHVELLLATLGSSAVKKPAINLDGLGYGYANVNDFLKLGRQFEDTGVSAYLGAAPLIQNKTYLAAAGAILGTEAQHSGSVRLACIWNGVKSPAVDSLDVPPTQSTPFDVDKNALSIPRTFSQVLKIVYGGGSCSGGFFPSGVNGNINCTS
mgnify:CR=1 FL=1